MMDKITVYVTSSFLSMASTETWSPIVGVIFTACTCLYANDVLIIASSQCFMQLFETEICDLRKQALLTNLDLFVQCILRSLQAEALLLPLQKPRI